MTDIWELNAQGYCAAIPTNLQVKYNGEAVMGAGLAKQAHNKFRTIARQYGAQLLLSMEYGPWPPRPVFISPPNVVCVATKYNWRDPSDLELIRFQLTEVAKTMNALLGIRLAVPRLGCGLGGLKWADVKPMIIDILPEGRYVFCEE